MKTKPNYKTPEQIEFLDLMKEMKERFGFNATKIAEIARCSSGMVSLIKKGTRSPGQPSLELLRKKLKELTEPGPGGTNTNPDVMQEKIEYLKKYDPPAYAAARVTIDALHSRSMESAPKRRRAVSSAKPGEDKTNMVAEIVEALVGQVENKAKTPKQPGPSAEEQRASHHQAGRQGGPSNPAAKKNP